MTSPISDTFGTNVIKSKKMFRNVSALLIAVFSFCCCSHKVNTTDVPDIKGKLLNGDSVALRTIAKDKLTVVNVWGIFCGPCMKELPILQSVYEKYRNHKGFDFITIAMDNETELNRFLNTTDTTDPYRKMFVHSNLGHFSLPTLSVLPHGYTHIYGGYAFFQDSTECRTINRMIKSNAVPTTLIYNPKGNLVFKQIGSFDNDQLLTHEIDSLLSL
ncbi:MAG: TlpA disulfide reductase family protein [Bacteroidota bacterium]|nr:TlpA disulfide reductase family protein [Bacteroidota bacterium]